jgi:hypothetical protein
MPDITPLALRIPDALLDRLRREAELRAAPFHTRPNVTATVIELLTARLDQLDTERSAHRAARKVRK